MDRRSKSGSKLRGFSSEQLVREEDGSDGENQTRESNKQQSKNQDNDAAENFKSMKERLHKKERRVAVNEPELHIIGEIEGGFGFGKGVCCRWQFDFGNMWQQLGGNVEGQTQVDYPVDGDSAVWAHPLDVHFLCKGIQGWPRLLLQVWAMDEFGRLELCGYGFTHVPSIPGCYELEVNTWRPVGTLKEEIAAQFLGVAPQLRDIDLLFSKAWSDRFRLSTTSSGTVRVNIDVVLRNFEDHNVDKS